ncbi:MAG: phosphoribosylanthranilate isomerase [bacterium]|nr:phosphoribosylanthranilate isomerase [bacterium]MXV90030.1 phosphoribosylanthranilate isomerase [Acidimicrobiia bacterium]MYC46540.1 phosphoribosylanthranilate isomerase [Acidimicrobiia bacterium]MYI19218.1 phosphoribosylanthranilate isomerase [Acidimicrobiia bacterium]
MFVKICGITSEEDGLLAVAMGADAVGFLFAPSPRRISPSRARDIAGRLPPEILTVGVFRNEDPRNVVRIANQARLRAVQLHGRESPEETQRVRRQVPRVIKAFRAGSEELEQARSYGADIILVDADQPGSGKVFDWALAERSAGPLPVIVAGGLTPENVAAAISKTRPWGVDVSTGVESAPGRKDPRLVREFVNAARQAAAELPAPEPPSGVLYDWQAEF